MRISVVGCGYLGVVHAAAMAELGHEVVGVDVDAAKIESLAAGRPTFFEPGLPEMLRAGISSGRLSFSTDIRAAAGSAVHFVAVGTPQRQNSYSADMSYVDAAIESLLPHLRSGDLVVGKSTVPVGTAAGLAAIVSAGRPGALLAWNPEFLREGFAVRDTISPDRIVYGVPADPSEAERATGLLDEVYAEALASGTPRVITDFATAELVKVSANAFLATKISFINAIAEIAEVSGADVTQLADAIGFDARIGRRFLNAGVGFGGGCLPKDIRAFAARAEELGRGESLAFLKEIDAINLRRRKRVVDLVLDAFSGSVYGRHIAVLGLAFKPDSDDVRDSPALDIAVQLHGLGAEVRATDPQAIGNARGRHPQLSYTDDIAETVHRAEIILLLTEWADYKDLEPSGLGEMTGARVIIDGRNVLEPSVWRSNGWTYHGMGR